MTGSTNQFIHFERTNTLSSMSSKNASFPCFSDVAMSLSRPGLSVQAKKVFKPKSPNVHPTLTIKDAACMH